MAALPWSIWRTRLRTIPDTSTSAGIVDREQAHQLAQELGELLQVGGLEVNNLRHEVVQADVGAAVLPEGPQLV